MLWFSRCLVAGDKLGFYDVMWKATAWTSFSMKCTGEYIWDILSIRNYPTLFYFNPFVDSCLSCSSLQTRIASFLQTGAPQYHVLSPLHMGIWNFSSPWVKRSQFLSSLEAFHSLNSLQIFCPEKGSQIRRGFYWEIGMQWGVGDKVMHPIN